MNLQSPKRGIKCVKLGYINSAAPIQVVDTFYVKDVFGLKYHSKTKRDMLEQKLRDALKQGTLMAIS